MRTAACIALATAITLSLTSRIVAAPKEPAGRWLEVAASPQVVDLAVPAPAGTGPDRRWQLVEGGGEPIPALWIKARAADGTIAAGAGQLVASIPARKDAKGVRRLRLEPAAAPADGSDGFQFREVGKDSLAIFEGKEPVLVYNHGMITVERVPKKDQRRTRSSYIHPLYGLQGETLTDDAPGDHTHHRGVFWAWPHITIDGKEYDLWVYNNIKQRFVGWLDRQAGPGAATLGVENGWFIGEKKVMIERVWLRVYRRTDGQRSLDLEFALVPVEKPITLVGAPGKSYGGLNLRFAPREQARITVPQGVAKEDLPDTPLAWADYSGRFKDPKAKEPSGAAIFIPPGHPDFPPTWLTRHYGILCVGWPGVKGKTFEPGKPIRLDYRIWMHRQFAELQTLKGAYEAYSNGLKAAWK